ncbi:MAG: formylglycine-generating enzyme family protein [Candidatus Marinimicrobia bacterium]|nr:formylglycine-generating enzyme family protein [Candidatus Neomarinimicrobiota bacterium]MBT4578845.1 formylglycine-generating enzyme family protein [Candidatus Neomarinimicrobiota bacterium]MBT5363289.1 formylglycine-generating enzyme family protein [Candidatus Neomarinimicrobiota bacterium]MBT5759586.1 formylglycine-generating enzyme family protein [Candidatus Neomarinimicrobiota bacterium]MBT6631701.1 formylglycine-generating enzyme family protein [Candidatus Neomarinimicrobiota bacterium
MENHKSRSCRAISIITCIFLVGVIKVWANESPKNDSLSMTLDGKSFKGQIKANGFLGFFKSREKLIFNDGSLITTSSKPHIRLPYQTFQENGKTKFTARGPTDYDGGTIEWTGTYNGESLENVKGDWIRGEKGHFLHDLLLTDVVTWFFTPDPIQHQFDYINMVLIPSGIFKMGNPAGEEEYDNFPVHTVKIDSFYMDKYEVTVEEFRQFTQETGYKFNWRLWEKHFVSPTDNHPMVNVDWNEATAYAEWSGKRLPTEAEWEYAARGGLDDMRYPWGNTITKHDANFHKYWKNDDEFKNSSMTGKDTWRFASPVGSFAPNGYGLYDMAGNASEWCQDFYSRNYYSVSPEDNPQGPETGNTKVTRGGHWYSWHTGLRVYQRGSNPPDVKRWQDVLGFRCVKDLD